MGLPYIKKAIFSKKISIEFSLTTLLFLYIQYAKYINPNKRLILTSEAETQPYAQLLQWQLSLPFLLRHGQTLTLVLAPSHKQKTTKIHPQRLPAVSRPVSHQSERTLTNYEFHIITTVKKIITVQFNLTQLRLLFRFMDRT
ncbi:hypothetical protein L1987_29055 [Smallanthus sonchifolius]|uniref:Uncharacterized protein n=1 Tax=Smallanthus sonchifolius TaxID=185202 RepID=A0ACB9HYX7_9ASTR|nr:hypothetical protein L1987_29055 [Smallanthus sonchifolius]